MHQIHHTEAFVIKSISSGEASKRIWLFTRDFGLIMAVVQGVRKPSAKLQGHISDYAYIKADLVKGREVWRLIGAEMISGDVLHDTRNLVVRSFVRSLMFVDRFLVDEGPHEEMFEHIVSCAEILLQKDIDHKSFDVLSLWRMLALLGYIAVEEHTHELMHKPLREAIDMLDIDTRSQLIAVANTAIKESHL